MRTQQAPLLPLAHWLNPQRLLVGSMVCCVLVIVVNVQIFMSESLVTSWAQKLALFSSSRGGTTPNTSSASTPSGSTLLDVRTEPHVTCTWLHNASFVLRSPTFDWDVSREKGVVIAVHNNGFALGMSLISELRCLGNSELIQVYHCTDDDLSLDNRQRLVNFDDRVEVIDVCGDMKNGGCFDDVMVNNFKSWWIKPLALVHTDLRQPLLLDVDAFLLRNPTIIRQTKVYVDAGTLFFYDRVVPGAHFYNSLVAEADNARFLDHILKHFNYTAFGLRASLPSQHLISSFAYRGLTCHEMDSSMVAIDKRRSDSAMRVLWWLITELRFRHDFSWGDKEAFWLAYELAQLPYAFSPWGVSVVSSSTNEDMKNHPDTLCGSIAQYMPVNETGVDPELLYVNGRAMLDPLTQGTNSPAASPNIMYNTHPTHAVPPMARTASKASTTKYAFECLIGLGSTPLPLQFPSFCIVDAFTISTSSLELQHTYECQGLE